MQTKIIAHENTPVFGNQQLGNSYEGLGSMLRKGFGVSVHFHITKNNEIVAANDPVFLEKESGGTFGEHRATADELLTIFRMFLKLKLGESTFLVIHLGNSFTENKELGHLLQKLQWFYPAKTIIHADSKAAAYLRLKDKNLNLATTLSAPLRTSELRKLKEIYNVIWLEESPGKTSWGQKEITDLRREGFLTGIQVLEKSSLSKALSLNSDFICTSIPEEALLLLESKKKKSRKNLGEFFKKGFSELTGKGLKRRIIIIREWFFLKILSFAEKKSGKAITFHTRPLYSKDITNTSDPLISIPPFAIVLQGPILKKNDFTLETIRIYKKVYRGATIILSTWEDEDRAYLEKIYAEKIEVVLNKKPEYNGPFNVNLQITTAKNGMERAKALGVSYALKTRTDQRMYNKNIFETMINLLEHFPASENSNQKKRLIFIHGFIKYQPYHVSDMFAFGDIDDMVAYWSPELVDKKDDYPFFVPEMFFMTTFLKKKGREIIWSIKAAWNVYKECFIPIDWPEVDLFWYKYDHEKEYRDLRDYQHHVPSQDFLRFHEWLNLLENGENKIILPEHNMFYRWFTSRRKE